MKKIYFRADASSAIGYGHFIRTLALADMLKKDFDCTFFTVNPTPYQVLEMEKVCKHILLKADTFLDDFLELLEGDEVIVLDNYFYTTDYQKQIKAKGCCLVCIDDMHDKHYVADVVINHGVSKKDLFSVESYTQLCLGYDWALLRHPFLQLSRRGVPNKQIENAVICFGGTDSNNLTERFASFLQKVPTIKRIIAAVGDRHQTCKSNAQSKVTYLRNLSADEMADLFSKSDIAFLSASTVCLEALSQNLPIAAGYYVDNQKGMYSEYVSHNLIYPLGDLLDIDIDKIDYSSIVKNRASWGTLNFNLIPGRYKMLFHNMFVPKEFHKNNLCFIDYRALDEHQHSLIWHARNDDSIRFQMEHTELIPWKSHLAYVKSLSAQYRKIYWAVYKEDKLIGSVNIEYDSVSEVERGIFILPEFWGKGDAALIDKSLFETLQEQGITSVAAKVLKNNSRSLHFHLKLGYKLVSDDEKYNYLVKDLK
ncbi:bifunctional UDP-2,4-diacetamido-2,4,6-trideoxy-beta-L-altropyranose hydrolase/GNAT family N-acetyltransferase [Bacteroides fluxus]|uniref:bifunctional UDP-2,4-diacetamido-2,4,6-trideoxy-beta-L-altropyranose hydrolase/GNAT family N-acetyltransferase n=1 Tax=Bacteroides fluxus TaxID=626930 RepID=UPI0023F24850|nr:bifunctional UDP-2,4-diacetamido-2,4,6-trideoxy-beta-L-altropyranose hydrolase/GNAT family N-acetyltransferase [Bacteroides fluxus]